jgi:multicomponent K+:H+ antiporter subunit D
MVSAALGVDAHGARSWIFAGVVLGCGQVALIALTRTGIQTFWSSRQHEPQPVRAAEAIPIVALLMLCGAMTVAAGPMMNVARATAHSLHDPAQYIGVVLAARVHDPTRGDPP